MSGTTFSNHNREFLFETLGLIQEFLSDILLDMDLISDIDSTLEFKRNSVLSRLTSQISQFVELTTLLSKTMLKKQSKISATIKESHIHLLFILKGMNQAQQKQDYIALDELIKYELKDNLTQWKIDLIPQVKRQLKP